MIGFGRSNLHSPDKIKPPEQQSSTTRKQTPSSRKLPMKNISRSSVNSPRGYVGYRAELSPYLKRKIPLKINHLRTSVNSPSENGDGKLTPNYKIPFLSTFNLSSN